MRKIVFLDRATIGPSVVLHRPDFPHEWKELTADQRDDLAKHIRDADYVITNKVPLRQDILAQAEHLKMIAVAATGYDVIDIAAARACGIGVCNVRGYAQRSVPEHVFALLFALNRNILAYHQSVAQGRWQASGQFSYFDYEIRDLAGQRLGIFGSGNLGRGVGAIGKALGMEVVYAERRDEPLRKGYLSFDEVLETSDVLSLHLPLTAKTRDMIGAAEFARLSRRPILINASRGGLVNEAAAVQALQKGQIRGLALDVLTSEPPQVDNPILSVMDRPDVIVTPHVAWAAQEAMQELWRQVIDNIEAYEAGEPRNLISISG